MKQVNEEQLLLAVGEVGDDLLLRAENIQKRPSSFSKFGAMAACFVLIAGLAIPNVMDSFKMGSDAGASENSMVGGADDPMADAGETDVSAMDLFGDQGLFLGEEKHAAAVLSLLGVQGAEDIASVSLHAKKESVQTTWEEDSVPNASLEHDDAEGLRGATVPEWYDVLLKSEIVLAEKDSGEPEFLTEVELVLVSGEILYGSYAPESYALQIGEYRFYNGAFSELFGKERSAE